MAIGDDATAAGMALVAATDDKRLGYQEINRTRDYIAADRTRITALETATASAAWVALDTLVTYQSGWTGPTGYFGYRPLSIRKIGKRVSLRGVVAKTSWTANAKICDLPVAYRPTDTIPLFTRFANIGFGQVTLTLTAAGALTVDLAGPDGLLMDVSWLVD